MGYNLSISSLDKNSTMEQQKIEQSEAQSKLAQKAIESADHIETAQAGEIKPTAQEKIEEQIKNENKRLTGMAAIKEKLASFFAEKPISKLDKNKLGEIYKSDAKSLMMPQQVDIEVGYISMGNTYRDLAKKYELGNAGEGAAKEIEQMAKELHGMNNSAEKQAKMEVFNKQRLNFMSMMRSQAEKISGQTF